METELYRVVESVFVITSTRHITRQALRTAHSWT